MLKPLNLMPGKHKGLGDPQPGKWIRALPGIGFPWAGAGSDGMLGTAIFRFWASMGGRAGNRRAQKWKVTVLSMPSEPAPPMGTRGEAKRASLF